MNKTIASLALSVLCLVGGPLLGGTASATSALNTLDVDEVDIWQLQCTSTATHCMEVSVCDLLPAGGDTFEVTLNLYSPVTVLGAGETATAPTGACSNFVKLCWLKPASHGALNAMVNVNHPFGGPGGSYNLVATCYDTNAKALPDSSTKLTIKTDE